ncbi:hypothetical protein AB1L88_11705 [Tautonia sp. JC769]|uniref:hypothetical protein n=1 Tax=Tautonia sp. JC769 TaxID=3232135 RepID=UPI003458A181
MTPNRGGRPTKFSAELGETIIDLLRQSVPRREIAARVGVGWRTLQEWLRRGRAGEEGFSTWAERFDLVAGLIREQRIEESWQRQEAESKERWQRFKAARQRWWLERLGPCEYWRRRLGWLASRGRWVAYHRTIERLREEGFRINDAP